MRRRVRTMELGREIAMIEVEQIGDADPLTFEVTIQDGSGETRHHVTMSRADHDRLTGGAHPPVRCIQAAFEFLLEREAKEAILRRFDVSVIARYFPEFPDELPRYIAARGR